MSCRCGKRMLQRANEGTCLWCGHGDVEIPVKSELRKRRRLPVDLGALAREGRRADPRLDNVIPCIRRRQRRGVLLHLHAPIRQRLPREEAA